MPSSVIHRIIGEKVLEKYIGYTDTDDIYMYKIGTIAPDSWRNTKRYQNSSLKKIDKRKRSHFQDDNSFIEKYEDFINKYQDKLSHPFMLGYLVHLMTDYYWRSYISRKYPVDNKPLEILEDKDARKKEKNILYSRLSSIYHLDYLREVKDEELNKLPIIDELEYDGLNRTINFSNSELEYDNDSLSIYKEENFIMGIDECSDIIIKEILKRKKHQ